MGMFLRMSILIYLKLLFILDEFSSASFNPFSDEELHAINWAGPADLDKLKMTPGDVEIVSVLTEENEKYHCVIPESQAKIDASKKNTYSGASPEELMEIMFSQSACSYRIEAYWTYELCHGKHVKQYHEDRELSAQKSKSQEYYLGKLKTKGKDEVELDPGDTPTEAKHTEEIKSIKIDGLDLPYYPVEMGDGTECDLTGKPRKSHVKYICQPNGRGEIFQLKETSSCEYDIIVLTAVLCSHPSFKPKDPEVSKIKCHAEAGSPSQPKRLTELKNEQGIILEPDYDDDEIEVDDVQIKVTPAPPKSYPAPQKTPKPTTTPSTKIGAEADKSLLRDFLTGEYCIHGGAGWWKHEFCYNKHAKQYHEDQSGTTSIFLGYWDKKIHLAWLQENPSKKPKPPGHRKHISLFYGNGDICDLTNKPRHVEVKLKCLKKTNQPHAVSIYLVEPDPCSYVLGVESPLFCDILDKADNDGLLDHIEV